MTEYTKADYLAACEACYDGKPTEINHGGKWVDWEYKYPPTSPDKYQWRVKDPLREYKEAFAQGKRVQSRAKFVNNWINDNDGWLDCGEDCAWSDDYEYRIVEPKTVKLYQWAFAHSRDKNLWLIASRLYPSYEKVREDYPDANAIMQWGDTFIEVKV